MMFHGTNASVVRGVLVSCVAVQAKPRQAKPRSGVIDPLLSLYSRRTTVVCCFFISRGVPQDLGPRLTFTKSRKPHISFYILSVLSFSHFHLSLHLLGFRHHICLWSLPPHHQILLSWLYHFYPISEKEK